MEISVTSAMTSHSSINHTLVVTLYHLMTISLGIAYDPVEHNVCPNIHAHRHVYLSELGLKSDTQTHESDE